MITKDYQLNYYDILTYADKIVLVDEKFIRTCVEKLPNWKDIVVKRHVDKIDICNLYDWSISSVAKCLGISQSCVLNILCKIQAEFEMYLYLNGNVYFRDGLELNINNNIKTYGEEENKNMIKIDMKSFEKLSKQTLLEYLDHICKNNNNITQIKPNINSLNKIKNEILNKPISKINTITKIEDNINKDITKKINNNIIKNDIHNEKSIIKSEKDNIKSNIKESNNIINNIKKDEFLIKQTKNNSIIKKDDTNKVSTKKLNITSKQNTNTISLREKKLELTIETLKNVSNIEEIFGPTQSIYIRELLDGKTIREICSLYNKNYHYLLSNICGVPKYRNNSEKGITLLLKEAKIRNKVKYKNTI